MDLVCAADGDFGHEVAAEECPKDSFGALKKSCCDKEGGPKGDHHGDIQSKVVEEDLVDVSIARDKGFEKSCWGKSS